MDRIVEHQVAAIGRAAGNQLIERRARLKMSLFGPTESH